MSEQPRPQALEDLTVLDLSRMRAGPTCVRQLGDWGARVIKVEDRGGSDFSARTSADFQNLHRNKRSITIDLKSPEGLAILHRMTKAADVLVENFRPDVKFRLGIDYESLKKINPRLIYVSISGFGQSGPSSNRPGLDAIAQGMSGLMSITGEPGRGPIRAGIALTDSAAGLSAALGVLVALHERTRSNLGQWVQTSLLQAGLFMLDFQAAGYLMNGEVPQQVGNDHPTAAPMGTYPAADSYVTIAPTPDMWPKFCKLIGCEHLIVDPRYASNQLRCRHRDDLNATVESYTRMAICADLVEQFNSAGIPCGPVYTIDQAFADPQVEHLGIAQDVMSEELGSITMVGQPFTLSRTPSELKSAAPTLGKHTDEILHQFGCTDAEITRLREAKVV